MPSSTPHERFKNTATVARTALQSLFEPLAPGTVSGIKSAKSTTNHLYFGNDLIKVLITERSDNLRKLARDFARVKDASPANHDVHRSLQSLDYEDAGSQDHNFSLSGNLSFP